MRSLLRPSILFTAAASCALLTGCGAASDTTATVPGAADAGAASSAAGAGSASSAAAAGSANGAAAAGGAYVDYATYQSDQARYSAGKVVLFFHAAWCPDCVRTEKNLEADPASIPAGVTIVNVDYDSSDDLKQKYGVTHQWTFVSVDAAGAKKKIWTGTDTGAAIAAKI